MIYSINSLSETYYVSHFLFHFHYDFGQIAVVTSEKSRFSFVHTSKTLTLNPIALERVWKSAAAMAIQLHQVRQI